MYQGNVVFTPGPFLVLDCAPADAASVGHCTLSLLRYTQVDAFSTIFDRMTVPVVADQVDPLLQALVPYPVPDMDESVAVLDWTLLRLHGAFESGFPCCILAVFV